MFKTLQGHEFDFLAILEPRHIYRDNASHLAPDLLLLDFSSSLDNPSILIDESSFVLDASALDCDDIPWAIASSPLRNWVPDLRNDWEAEPFVKRFPWYGPIRRVLQSRWEYTH